MRAFLLIAALFALVSVHAGVLFIETVEIDGTTLKATWLHGVERVDVHFRNGEVYRENVTLISGPNRCFAYGADGNDRAILVEPSSDDRGPHTPDAIVDCSICGCEDTPGTRFTCGSSGRCEACDPCEEDTCGTGEVCIRESCTEASCACDPIACAGETCEGSRTVSRACAQDRCEASSACVEGSCGAECSTGSVSRSVRCDGSELVSVTSTCSSFCTSIDSVELIEDCSERSCGPGREPICTRGGCRCA